MKLVSYRSGKSDERLGIIINDAVYDLQATAKILSLDFPGTMNEFLSEFDQLKDIALRIQREIETDNTTFVPVSSTVILLAPVPHPPSCRDAYAFRQHVATARKNRGAEMIPEFDQFPVFYFTNHQAVCGEGDLTLEQDHFEQLDFELECAIVIGRKGKNIRREEADSYIAGLTIMNDFSARKLQMEEMKLSLGPAKGKDFATAFGPWLVTTDELESVAIDTPFGRTYDLEMTAVHNGQEISRGNLKDMNWTFAEIIERASYGVELFPGDIIGSGTVGTGCYLELNGTRSREAKAQGKSYEPVWLQPGDTIELAITELGSLKNTIHKAKDAYSIIAKKKRQD